MTGKVTYHCDLCGAPFEVEQGSKRRLCDSCQDKRAIEGLRKAQEARRKKAK